MNINYLLKYRFLKILLGAVLGVITAGTLQAQNEPVNRLKVRFPEGRNSVEIPFQTEDNIPVIAVSINGSRPLRMTFDTGSETPILYGAIDAKPLNLEITGQTEVQGAGSGAGILASIAGNVTYDFAGLQLFGSELVALPKVETAQITQMQTSGIAGVIGRPVFENLVVELDWEKQTIKFSDPQTYRYTGKGAILPLTFDQNGIPHLATIVSIDGKTSIPVKLLVDTGGSHAMSLDVGSHPAIKVPRRNLGDSSASGLTGSYKLQTALVRKLKLGGYTLKDVTTSFIDTTTDVTAMQDGRQGLLGSEVLRRFKVIFDYSRRRMILEPHAALNTQFPYSLSGFRSTRIPATKNLLIREVIENSAAKKAGLLAGDEITAVNGRAAAEIPGEELYKLYREEGKILRLTINRQGGQLMKTFRLKRFL